MATFLAIEMHTTISFPESSFPLTSGRKTRALGTTISGMRHKRRLRSETGWTESPEFGYFKMVYFVHTTEGVITGPTAHVQIVSFKG